MQHDDIVSGWLSGDDSIDNPAGPLYLEGQATTEAALTQNFRATLAGPACASLHGSTTCSGGGGCNCC